MGFLKKLNRANKQDEKIRKERLDAYLAELKLLTDKYHLEITASLRFTPQGIYPYPDVREKRENAEPNDKA